jgi:hypothetical protein
MVELSRACIPDCRRSQTMLRFQQCSIVMEKHLESVVSPKKQASRHQHLSALGTVAEAVSLGCHVDPLELSKPGIVCPVHLQIAQLQVAQRSRRVLGHLGGGDLQLGDLQESS